MLIQTVEPFKSLPTTTIWLAVTFGARWHCSTNWPKWVRYGLESAVNNQSPCLDKEKWRWRWKKNIALTRAAHETGTGHRRRWLNYPRHLDVFVNRKGGGGGEPGRRGGYSCSFSQKWAAPVSVSGLWNAMLYPQTSHGVGGVALRGQPFTPGFLLAAANRWAPVSIQSKA